MFDFPPKYFRIINYSVAAIILVTSLLLTRNIISSSFSSKKPDLTATEPSRKSPAIQTNSLMHYSPILEQNPFGPPLKLHPVSVEQQQETAQQPLSSLILIGTAVGSEKPGYAIFIDKSDSSKGKQEIFAFGENVYSYGKLINISASSVDLERNSDIYTISISYDDIKENKGKSRIRKTRFRKPSSKKSFAKKIGEGKYMLDSRKVQQSLANPEKLLTDARLLPVIKNGKQEGFIISEVVPDGMYHSLGLKNGDTLLKINGLKISNPEVAIQAMSALKGMSSIDLDIIRDGAKMSMSYQIR